MPAQHDETPNASTTPGKAKRKTMSITTRNLLMIVVGVAVLRSEI